jgi:hypothetical protein
MGPEKLASSEHSDFQQQESGNCWGTESLGVVGWQILVLLAETSAETVAK